jgi:AcrR family transcriptional regulator
LEQGSVEPGGQREDGRRRRSLRTRARIVAAATDLFVERGYLGTTIEAVADVAGVAAQTVYYVFGTKRSLLAAVLDASIAGDVEPVAVLDRPWFDALGDEADAAASVAHLAAVSAQILARAAPIYDVVRRASADPDVGRLLEENRAQRRSDQQRLVEMLADAGHLRPGLDADAATDIVYGLVNEEVHLLFTGDCGWDLERFQRWMTELLLQQLLGVDV